jgi:hypothetical protein
LIEKYGHYLLGRRDDRYFVAIPGRFLRAEQPCREAGLFSLWQPVRGGEAFFDDLETLEGSLAEGIFGYWIGEVGPGGREIQPI